MYVCQNLQYSLWGSRGGSGGIRGWFNKNLSWNLSKYNFRNFISLTYGCFFFLYFYMISFRRFYVQTRVRSVLTFLGEIVFVFCQFPATKLWKVSLVQTHRPNYTEHTALHCIIGWTKLCSPEEPTSVDQCGPDLRQMLLVSEIFVVYQSGVVVFISLCPKQINFVTKSICWCSKTPVW